MWRSGSISDEEQIRYYVVQSRVRLDMCPIHKEYLEFVFFLQYKIDMPCTFPCTFSLVRWSLPRFCEGRLLRHFCHILAPCLIYAKLSVDSMAGTPVAFKSRLHRTDSCEKNRLQLLWLVEMISILSLCAPTSQWTFENLIAQWSIS
jgi:hypothetical protein